MEVFQKWAVPSAQQTKDSRRAARGVMCAERRRHRKRRATLCIPGGFARLKRLISRCSCSKSSGNEGRHRRGQARARREKHQKGRSSGSQSSENEGAQTCRKPSSTMSVLQQSQAVAHILEVMACGKRRVCLCPGTAALGWKRGGGVVARKSFLTRNEEGCYGIGLNLHTGSLISYASCLKSRWL